MTLSSRIAAAPVEQTGLMLEEAWRFIHGSSHWTGKTIGPGDKFGRFLNAQAYHDAAMMLIPDDWMITFLSELGLAGGCVCELGNPATSQDAKSDEGARTIPLAIAAAAVRIKE